MGVDGDVKVGAIMNRPLSICWVFCFNTFTVSSLSCLHTWAAHPLTLHYRAAGERTDLCKECQLISHLCEYVFSHLQWGKTDGLPDVIKECVEKGVVCVSEDKTGLEWHTSRREVLWEGDGGDMQCKSCYKSLSRHVFVCVYLCVWERKIDIVMYHDCKLLCKVTRAIPLPFLA